MLLLVLAALFGGCGGDDGAPAVGAGVTLRADAVTSGALRFDREMLEAEAGPVTIVMANPSSVPHAIGVKRDGLDEQGEEVGRGERSTVSVELAPGSYTFYCPVGSHEQAGMRGTLEVR